MRAAPSCRSPVPRWRAARLLAVGLVALLPATARSQVKPMGKPSNAPPAPAPSAGAAKQFLAALDANKDGAVARGEWRGSGSTFLSLDTDLDGYLTQKELARKGTPPAGSSPVTDPNALERIMVRVRELRDPPDLFTERCLSCHDEQRILRAEQNASGWATTVDRMRKKKETKISEKEAKVIVDYLNSMRSVVAKAAVGYGSDDPRRDWSFVVGGGDLHLFDRDRSGKLDAGELARLAFEHVDVDGNGALSAGEFSLLPLAADRRALFARLDRDGNGAISLKELGAPPALLDVADGNGDGTLTRDELPRTRDRGPFLLLLTVDAKLALELLDRNHDDRLSSRELERFPVTLQRFDENRDSELDMKELETAVTAARAEGLYLAFDDFLTRYDLDGDGAVSRLEFPGKESLFRRFDGDGDGEVSAKEAPGGWRRPDFTPEAQRWR